MKLYNVIVCIEWNRVNTLCCNQKATGTRALRILRPFTCQLNLITHDVVVDNAKKSRKIGHPLLIVDSSKRRKIHAIVSLHDFD